MRSRSCVAAGTSDGSDWLFAELEGDGATCVTHLQETCEIEVDRRDVEHVLALQPLSEELVRRLDHERGLADLAEDIARIGCPSST